MAKPSIDTASQCAGLIDEIRKGSFHPIYLLMGEEAFYPDMVCREILEHCIDPAEKDFNELIFYGADTDANTVTSAARQFPMLSERVLVVLKEAQMMKTLENLAVYCEHPLDSTVLVILMHGASADKRKNLYKTVSKTGVVVESPLVKDYEMPRWIEKYYKDRGLEIEPGGANLLSEYIGCNLSAIAIETDKLLHNLPQGASRVSIEDIEKNVGISRQFSIFELTKELCRKDSAKALKIAAHVGNAAKFSMPMAVSVIFNTFSKVLRYEAMLLRTGGRLSPADKAAALSGVNPYFYKDYDAAVQQYPLPKTMKIISLLCDYDYLGKGGDGVETSDGELLVELVAKILTL